jgi:hypothetical protein
MAERRRLAGGRTTTSRRSRLFARRPLPAAVDTVVGRRIKVQNPDGPTMRRVLAAAERQIAAAAIETFSGWVN